MKKKIALLLAAVMVVGSLPMTAFASSDNYVSSIKTVEDGDPIEASVFVEEFKGIGTGTEELQTIKLTLTNAKFTDDQKTAGSDVTGDLEKAQEALKEATTALKDEIQAVLDDSDVTVFTFGEESTDVSSSSADDIFAMVEKDEKGTFTVTGSGTITDATDLNNALGDYRDAVKKLAAAQSSTDVKYTRISDTEYMAEFYANDNTPAVELEIFAEADGSGDATVTIEATDSVVSSQTLKIATIADGATTATISGTTSIEEGGSTIKNIVITETTKGSIDDGQMRIRLTNGFTFKDVPTWEGENPDIVVFPSGSGLKITNVIRDNDDQDLLITFDGPSTTAATVSVGGLNIAYDEDDVEIGDECTATISGAGTTRQSLVVGTAADYTISFTAEDKDLPTFYAGTYEEDTDSLVVTIKEAVQDAWITGRKAKIVFPEGVEVVEVTVEDDGNTDATSADNSTGNSSNITIDENEVDLSNVEVDSGKKAELELSFKLSVSPEFTGDITATLTGSGVGDDQEVTVGTVAFPVTVDADVNELKIDYRNTEASDIVITEADAGVLKKDTTVRLAIDGISFDGDPTVEVESGDMKIDNVKVDGEYLVFDIDSESQKEAAVIRISDINLYMSRSLPAGEYDLLFVTDKDEEVTSENGINDEDDLTSNAIIRNYSDTKDCEQGTFDVDDVTILDGYVTVVTAGRDQDDSTFTTTVKVTIGADKMYAGTKEIALDVPAYISNGYTMMPVRAVTEALSGSAIVRWDDPTKTVTITFGQRVISMTVGSSTMKINGVDVAMQAQCEITGERAFIPLRDLGYALGLNDSKIAWDDATKTATLN